MSNSVDQKTLAMIEKVKEKKSQIAKLERPNYKTNMSFSYGFNRNESINLQTVNDVRELLNIAAFIQTRAAAYYEAAKTLKVTQPPSFEWNGFSSTDWLDDIELRINKSQITAKKKELEQLESRLNSIISPELRAQMELEEIERQLS